MVSPGFRSGGEGGPAGLLLGGAPVPTATTSPDVGVRCAVAGSSTPAVVAVSVSATAARIYSPRGVSWGEERVEGVRFVCAATTAAAAAASGGGWRGCLPEYVFPGLECASWRWHAGAQAARGRGAGQRCFPSLETRPPSLLSHVGVLARDLNRVPPAQRTRRGGAHRGAGSAQGAAGEGGGAHGDCRGRRTNNEKKSERRTHTRRRRFVVGSSPAFPLSHTLCVPPPCVPPPPPPRPRWRPPPSARPRRRCFRCRCRTRRRRCENEDLVGRRRATAHTGHAAGCVCAC